MYFSSDDEDDTAELLAELERIKKERAEEKLRKVHFSSSVAFANIGFCLDHSSLVDCGDSYSNLIAEQPLLSLVQTRRPRDSTVCGMFTCSLDLPWQERQHQDQEMKVKEAELVRGNPLLNPTSFTVKRRYDELQYGLLWFLQNSFKIVQCVASRFWIAALSTHGCRMQLDLCLASDGYSLEVHVTG